MMRTAPLRKNQPAATGSTGDGLQRALVISVGLHLVVLVVLTIRAVIFPSADIPLENSIRVDMVALPDKIAKLPQMEEAPAPPVKKPAKPEPEVAKPPATTKVDLPKPAPVPIKAPPTVAKPEAPKVDLNKSKAEQAAALKRLEAIERLKRAAESQEARDTTPKKTAVASAPTIVKGNEISKGSSLTGVSKLDHASYLESVHQQVRKHLNLPRWLTNASLVAKVRLFIDAQGNVEKKVLTQSSKQPVYDDKLMGAIDAAAPLPPPPSDLVNLLAVEGLEIEFAIND